MKRFMNKRADESGAHPLVRQFLAVRRSERVAFADIAERSGVPAATMRSWRCRCNPTIDKFQAALNSIGYELVIKERG